MRCLRRNCGRPSLEFLIEKRNRRAESLASAADRILKGIDSRVGKLESTDEIAAYFDLVSLADARRWCAGAAAEGDRPLLVARGLPVRRDDRGRRQVQAVLDVVVKEVLREEEIDVFEDDDSMSMSSSKCPGTRSFISASTPGS